MHLTSLFLLVELLKSLSKTMSVMTTLKTFTSLISYKSMLPSSRPADFTAAGMAAAGPTPMTAGSTPTAAKLLKIKFTCVTNFK